MKRLAICSALIGFLIAPLLMPAAHAQTEAEVKAQIAKLKPKDFPTQPIEITVAFPAGGAMDINARHIVKYFEKWSGQKALVNNRTGAAGLVGHSYLATQAKNDGHTLGVFANTVFADSILRAQGRWTYNDIEPITYLNSDGTFLVVAGEGPYKDKTLKDMVELARQHPNTIRVAFVPGTPVGYMIEQIESVAEVKFLKVPFQGSAPAVTALLGNHIDVGISYYAELTSMMEARKIIPVAVSSAERSPFLPNLPTLNDIFNRKDMGWMLTRWVTAPKGIPADRKAYLVAAFNAAVRDPELLAEYRKLGTVPKLDLVTPAQATQYLNRLAEIERDFYVKSGYLK